MTLLLLLSLLAKHPDPAILVWQQCHAGCRLGETKAWDACMRRCLCDHGTDGQKKLHCKSKNKPTRKPAGSRK
jgi:hypothetical protein